MARDEVCVEKFSALQVYGFAFNLVSVFYQLNQTSPNEQTHPQNTAHRMLESYAGHPQPNDDSITEKAMAL